MIGFIIKVVLFTGIVLYIFAPDVLSSGSYVETVNDGFHWLKSLASRYM